MTTGEEISTRSLIWCVGVRADPLVAALSLPTDQGRLQVHETLVVPGHAHVFACGDCAAVPDVTRPGSVTGMTAQHAQRQGKLVARNVAASLNRQDLEPYKHSDLGFLVDLGGRKAAANPLHIPLAGLAAKTVTRGYHLLSLPGNRSRTATDWVLNTIMPRAQYSSGWSTRGGCRSTARVRPIDRPSRARALSHPNCSRPVDLQANEPRLHGARVAPVRSTNGSTYSMLSSPRAVNEATPPADRACRRGDRGRWSGARSCR
jgi:NADH dehydrogenase